MAQEFETKVLNIDVVKIVKKLEELGAKREKEILYRRFVFTLDSPNDEWIRLREDGENATITYKFKAGQGINETEEIEVMVDDFEKAAELLSKLKFKEKIYQENKRILFKLKNVEFAVDFWPNIPALLEIESNNEEKVKESLRHLGLVGMDSGNLSVINIYKKYGIDLHSIKELKFKD
ncbi:MAG: CYTH domain-containing protein [Candidatus Nanoarchaeia archaeon]|nr:CYTH domain-containing protein [Candidatus Nanoarchaeia archaeon]